VTLFAKTAGSVLVAAAVVVVEADAVAPAVVALSSSLLDPHAAIATVALATAIIETRRFIGIAVASGPWAGRRDGLGSSGELIDPDQWVRLSARRLQQAGDRAPHR
jgi:hypothetical protein